MLFTEWLHMLQSDLFPHFLNPVLACLLDDLADGDATLDLTMISLKDKVLL